MSFNISTFAAELHQHGVLRTNKFRVRFGSPPGLLGLLPQAQRSLELWCSEAVVPGLLVAPGESRRYGYGPGTKNPVAPIYQDASFVLLLDAKGKTYDFFNRWMRLVLNHDGFGEGVSNGGAGSGVQDRSGVLPDQHPWELGYLDEVASDVDITVFNDTGKEAMALVLRSAWPFSLGAFNLNWADKNGMIRIPISMYYSDYHHRPLAA